MADDGDDRPAFGTRAQDAPVTRAELERALRYQNLADLELRDMVLRLGAQVVALTDELVRRLDGVEPEPAPPATPAAAADGTVEVAVSRAMSATVAMVMAGDERAPDRLQLDPGGDKYEAEPVAIPCEELIPLCHARCCKLDVPLSTRDLDEGVLRWDYGVPYLLRRRERDGYCVHNAPEGRGCTVHGFRPRICRIYDCRHDDRIWIDYDQRIPALPLTESDSRPVTIDLGARARARAAAVAVESRAVRTTQGGDEPEPGPPPDDTRRRR
jgi:Fe-S-cluster containining protein